MLRKARPPINDRRRYILTRFLAIAYIDTLNQRPTAGRQPFVTNWIDNRQK
jgi:hypothetical protein